MEILKSINWPEDLKKIAKEKLPELAKEIRERIISVVSESGGHLAPSLGVVELTVALHYVYDSPKDKIIWDVSHQAYAHKILTGRNHRFHTIRQHGGLSGYTSIFESEHDIFGTGHASTSISAALGIAVARDIKKEDYSVIAVIGDGSLTGGLAFEGLNNGGMLNTNITVVLNDNKMAISPNVGAISRYLNKVILDPRYNRIKDEIWKLTERFESNKRFKYLSGSFRHIASRVDEAVKHLLLPGKFFEDLGFRYFGPVDGHDINSLIEIFQSIKKLHGPKIVHVITTKGKGFEPAEENKELFHGLSSFERETGFPKKKPDKMRSATYSEIFGITLCKIAKDNKNVVGITAAMAPGTGMKIFAEKFPERFFDVGIAEAHAVTFAAGLAVNGFYPVVAIYSTFMQRAFDQLIHDAALQKLPMLFCLDRAGLSVDDGPTHHGAFDISYCRCIPNVVLMAPKDENEFQHMMFTATLHKDGPVFIRYPKGEAVGVGMEEDLKQIEIGKFEILESGKEIAIFGYGEMVQTALEVSGLLKDHGVFPTIVNGRFAKPIDFQCLRNVIEEHKIVVTMEANSVNGGYGSGIMEIIHENDLICSKILKFGYPDKFITHGSKSLLYKELGIDPQTISRKILCLFSHTNL